MNVSRYVSGCERNGARKLTFEPALARVTARSADHVFAACEKPSPKTHVQTYDSPAAFVPATPAFQSPW